MNEIKQGKESSFKSVIQRFHGFRQAEFAYGGWILGPSHFHYCLKNEATFKSDEKLTRK